MHDCDRHDLVPLSHPSQGTISFTVVVLRYVWLRSSYYTHGYRGSGGPSSEHHDGAISEPETVRLIHEEGVAKPEGNGGDMGGEEAAGSPVRVGIN